MNPVYKIETLTGAVLDHTITKTASNIRFQEVLTSGIGTFAFTLPTKKGDDYVFNDIAEHDKVKFYVGYDTVPANPNFIGRVTRISGPLRVAGGYTRQITGLSQGEILLRRFKRDTRWSATEVDDIVDEVADDLSLGKDFVVDTTAIDYEVGTRRYFDVLKDISDFWESGGTQIKKDFYVNPSYDLVWKARPIRSAGVETLTVGKNIIDYDVIRAVNAVKNDITVYGAREKRYPQNGDDYTEQTAGETIGQDGWTCGGGVGSWNNTDSTVGSESVQNAGVGVTSVTSHNSLIGETSIDCSGWKKNSYAYLNFDLKMSVGAGSVGIWVQLYLPDNTHRKEIQIGKYVTTADWYHYSLMLGPDSDDAWYTMPLDGTPDWADCQALVIGTTSLAINQTMLIDALNFSGCRYNANVADAASKTSYGHRDLEVIDETLHSDSVCTQRANTMLYQLKDPPTQITVVVTGNSNVLVGDRLPMTIPAENISAVNYDVISVENNFDARGWVTKAVMVDSAEIRKPVTSGTASMLQDVNSVLRGLATEQSITR